MLIATINTIPGKNVEVLGLVQGSTIQSQHLGKDIGAAFKNLIGGELTNYNKMLTEARNIALDRMSEQAKEMGADAIVGVRFASSSIVSESAEIAAYGTAIKYV